MYWIVYLAAVAVMSLVTFFLYAADKRKAQKKMWRIPEKVLLLCSFFLGAAGGLSAMYVCRHKTDHWYFVVVNAASLILHVVLFFVIYNI